MTRPSLLDLSRREREIMEIVYRLCEGSASDVRASMKDPPSYSAVRAFLRLLEGKGYLRHKVVGRKYLFLPTVPAANVRRSALRNLLHTFFGGSVEAAVSSLLDLESRTLSSDELDRLSELIEKAKAKGGPS
jgi:predicted transcriptional regulator